MKLSNVTNQSTTLVEQQLNSELDDTREIRAHLLPYLENEIKKLNRRANKLGTPPITLTVNKTFFKELKDRTDAFGNPIKEKYVEVTVEGEPPHIPGYDFLATIVHKDGGNVVRMVPGADETGVKNFYNAKPDYCDHCKKKRKRIDTFIIKDQQSGELRQIGRNCLSDFLGGRDPKAILFWTQRKGYLDDIFREIDEDSYSGSTVGRRERAAEVETVLKIAAALVMHYGYRKADYHDYSESTAGMVKDILFNPPLASAKERYREYKERLKLIEDSKEKAEAYVKAVREWFDSLPKDKVENNNYLHNLSVLLNGTDATPRDVGILASVFAAYERGKEDKAKAEDGAKKSNDWVGKPGDKLDKVKVMVVNAHIIDGYYGENQIVKMEDDAGNSYTWFNSGANRMEKDSTYYIKGTIKKHDEYRGRNTTVLTRVKFEEI